MRIEHHFRKSIGSIGWYTKKLNKGILKTVTLQQQVLDFLRSQYHTKSVGAEC